MRRPATTTPHRDESRAGRRELLVFAVAYLVYFGVRAMTEGDAATAVRNALRLHRLERTLDVDWEAAVQRVVLDTHWLLDAANAVYMYGHWPVLIIGGTLLFHLRRGEYFRLRNVCLLSGALGLIVFALFPVAPPRLAPTGLVDTITAHANGYRKVLPTTIVNEYAAMPSFHAGWNLVLGVELFRASRHAAIRMFAVVMPLGMAFAVVATANHFIVDVVAGALVVLTALAAVGALERRREHAAPAAPRAAAGPAAACRGSGRQRPAHRVAATSATRRG